MFIDFYDRISLTAQKERIIITALMKDLIHVNSNKEQQISLTLRIEGEMVFCLKFPSIQYNDSFLFS